MRRKLRTERLCRKKSLTVAMGLDGGVGGGLLSPEPQGVQIVC